MYRIYGWLKNGEYPNRARVAGLADITEHYANCFGPPPVGRRIFLRASTMVDGFESLPSEFRARVPAP
jgi:hypothetical protein